MPKLHVLQGADVGKSYEVADGATIGRDPSCAIVLRDASVSRKHAEIVLRDGRWFVVDTGSRNGVTLGGARVTEAELADLTELSIGDVALRFRANSSAGASGGAPAATAEVVAPKAPSAPSVATPARAPAKPAQPTDSGELDEIVLEGEWDSAPAAPATPAATNRASAPIDAPADASAFGSASAASASSDSAAESSARAPRAPAPKPAAPRAPGVERSAPGDPRVAAPRTGAFANTPASLAATAARRAPQGPVEIASRGVLQYHKVENRAGVFNADLAQMSVLTKVLIAIAALAIAAGVFWFAFHGASFLKGKTQGEPEATDVETSEPR